MTRPAPSAALLDHLARRFGDAPGHADWRARQAAPAPATALPRGGHTELALERIVEQDARIRPAALPACWSAYS